MLRHSFGFVFLRRSLVFDLCLFGVSLLGHVDCPPAAARQTIYAVDAEIRKSHFHNIELSSLITGRIYFLLEIKLPARGGYRETRR